MVHTKHVLALASAAIALLVTSLPASADLTCGFETGLGNNGKAISNDIPGLAFSTVAGYSVYYADINTGWYSATSDNGKSFEDGNYFVSGDVAAYVANVWDVAKISMSYGTASYFTVGYSSEFPLTVEAYNAAGTQLSTVTGAVNSKSSGGTGLKYLTVTGQDISYVLIKGTGGYWMADNISTDAVPEPASILALAGGLVGLIALKRR